MAADFGIGALDKRFAGFGSRPAQVPYARA